MASSREDFIIAIRSAFLKKETKQKFSLLTLLFISILIIFLSSLNFKFISKMSKNVRISLYILIPVIIWMISGQFVQESEQEEKINDELTSVVVSKSESVFFFTIN